MYATRFKADPFDPAYGKLYRDKILCPGSSRDEIDILQASIDSAHGWMEAENSTWHRTSLDGRPTTRRFWDNSLAL